MNLPNRITIARICLIPLFLVIMLLDFGNFEVADVSYPVSHFIGACIFIFASATDWVDGYYARKYNLVTNMGKFLDPLADKLLVTAAFVLLVELQYVPAWIVVLILSREFAVTGLRLLLVEGGEVCAASMLGKIKTVTQIVAISAYLLHDFPLSFIPGYLNLSVSFSDLMIYIALFFTVYSGYDYFVKNRSVFQNSK